MPTGPEDGLVHRRARRRSTRYPIHGEVSVTAPIEASGFLFNASAGGMRLAVDRAIEVGSVLEMRVRFSGDREVTETAEVVWCRELPDGWLAGVRFVES